jgi:hypothetical protein
VRQIVVLSVEANGRGASGGLRFSMLDLRLGGRMLVKHPALTVIATIAVAFAIAVGTVGFEIARQALWPTIPLPDGNAIVALRNWNVADYASVPASRRDYELWRDGLSTITDLSAVEVEERSIAVGAGAGQPETVANVTASTFALTRVPALMGRTLLLELAARLKRAGYQSNWVSEWSTYEHVECWRSLCLKRTELEERAPEL